MQNRLHKQASQQKKLVNNGKLPKNTNNIVDFDLFKANHYHKPVSQDAWKPYQSFFSTYNISPTHAYIFVCLLEFQRRNKPAYHRAIANYTGCSEKTIQRFMHHGHRSGLINYTHGRNIYGAKLPSTVTILIDLPPVNALKSYARLKKRNQETIDNFDKQEIARRAKKARERHAMKDPINTDKKENVHLINNKQSLLKNTQVIAGKILKKLEYFELTNEIIKEAEEKYLIPKWQLIRIIERYKNKKLLEGERTREKWHSDVMNLLKTGRSTGFDYTPKEMEFYNEKIKEKHMSEVHEHTRKQIYNETVQDEDTSLTYKGVCSMIALKFGDQELRCFTDIVKDIEFDINSNRVIFRVGTPNYVRPRPHWENLIKHYHNMIDYFIYEQKR